MILVVDCFKLVRGAGKSIGIYNLALNLVRNLVEEKAETKDSEIKQCRIVVLGNAHNEKEFNIPGVEFVCIEHDPLNKLRCIWWELFEVSMIAGKYHADKMIHPRGYAPILSLHNSNHPVRYIITAVDINPTRTSCGVCTPR